jgi:hypothetical protein
MVRWGTAVGMGSFSTTVPEKAWGEKKVLCHGTVEKYKSRNWCEGQSQRTGSDLEAARCAWKCCGAVVLRVAVAGVAVRRVVVAHTAADQSPGVQWRSLYINTCFVFGGRTVYTGI